MQRKTSLLFGLTLILLGVLALAGNLLLRVVGNGFLLGFRAWPIFVVGAGLLFCLPPFIFSKVRGLSGLFIPGLPILTTGVVLFIASITGNWHIWNYLWPLEVISIAAGFVLMGMFLKIPWLIIPASIIGMTGLVLQFCAATGWWSSWAVLWTVEPFAVGLPLLLIGVFKKIEGIKMAGIILCGVAGLAFAAMSSLLVTSLWITRLIGPAIVLALGILLVTSALVKHSTESRTNKETQSN
jgi:general stress protein CsbA